MENFRELIDAFISFYNSAEAPLKFGIILILCVIALTLLVYIPRSIVSLIQTIISPGKKKNKKTPEEAPSEQATLPAGLLTGGNFLSTENERRTAQYFGTKLRDFQSDVDSIPMEELTEEASVVHSAYSIENLSTESKFHLSEKKKSEIQRRFEVLGTKELKKQKNAYLKKKQATSDNIAETTTTYRALLASRDKAEDQCIALHKRHKESLAKARACQEKVKAGRKDIGENISAAKEALDRGIIEKEEILRQFEQNKKKNTENAEKGGKLIISAQDFVATSKREIIESEIQYRDDAAAYLGGLSELGEINDSLCNCLENYGNNVKQSADCDYALICIEERLTAIQKALEEKRRQEEEEAARIQKEKEEAKAQREREKAEKKAEAKRLAMEKAEAERAAREKAEAERARKEAEEKAEKERLAILQSQQEMNGYNQKADSAASKAEELDNRAKALEEQEAAIEAQRLSLAEERERERAEKERQKAAAKAERERKEAQEKAERAAREKAELEALEGLTEEEKEMRRKIEEANSEFNPRSSLAAEEGFVNEQRIAEIEESQRMLANEQAKRQAEKEARQKALETKHSKIMENDAIIDDENMTPEERTEALRRSWREERENRERFEAEKSRRALETERRRKELSSMNNADQE